MSSQQGDCETDGNGDELKSHTKSFLKFLNVARNFKQYQLRHRKYAREEAEEDSQKRNITIM